MVTGLRTGDIGGCCPDLAEGHDLLVILVHDAHTKETMTALAEDRRLGILDHALLSEDILPLGIAREVIEIGGCQLTEVATSHLHAADVLQVVELRPLLLLCVSESLDGFVLVIMTQRVIITKAEGLGEDGTVGGIGPGCHRGTTCLEHDAPTEIGVGNALRIGLAIADGEEEVDLVAGLVDDIGDAVATLADAEVIVGQSSA